MPDLRHLILSLFIALIFGMPSVVGQTTDSLAEFDTTTFLKEESSESEMQPAAPAEEGDQEAEEEEEEDTEANRYAELMRSATDTLYDTLSFQKAHSLANPMDWKGPTRGLDYKEKALEEKDPVQPNKKSWNWGLPKWNWPLIGQYLGKIGLGLILVLLAFLVFQIVRSSWKETELKREELFSWDTNPDKLSLAFLEESLQKALREGNKPAALRIMFLMVLKDLNSLGMIRWRRNKTNLHYLREIENPAILKPFRVLSYAFDAAQYGGYSISDTAFSKLDREFRSLSTFLEPFRQAGSLS